MSAQRGPWLLWTMRFLGSLGLLLLLQALCWLISGAAPLESAPGRAAAGLFLALWLFLAGYGLLRLLLGFEWAPLSVARTTLDEVIRLKVAATFILVLFATLAVLPFALNSGSPPQHRIQTFLSFGLGLTGTLLGLLTIFLSCATLSGELHDKRIFSVLTKPLGRGAFLFGKWLGIVLLDALLILVAGVALYGSTALMARQAIPDAEDAKVIDEEVFAARESVRPQPMVSHSSQVSRELEALRTERPDFLRQLGEASLRKQHPDTAEAILRADPQRVLEAGAAEARAELLEKADRDWRTLGPHARQTYVFRNLKPAFVAAEFVQFRYKMMAFPPPPGGSIMLSIYLNDRPAHRALKTGLFEVLRIPADKISADGELRVAIVNENPRDPRSTFETTLTLLPEDGLEILYRAGDFGWNLARTMAILLIKLSFLAILGLASATCLGFPVATLLTLMLFAVASASGFLLEALTYFGENARFEEYQSSTSIFRILAGWFTQLLGQFSRFSPEPQLVDGRLVAWGEVLACAGWIGLVWSGLAGAVGCMIFRFRELGKVQV